MVRLVVRVRIERLVTSVDTVFLDAALELVNGQDS